jgi:hypothetical protein
MSEIPNGCVDGEAHSRDIAPGDDQKTGGAVECVPDGADLRILERLVALGFHLGGALASDPEQGGVSEDRAERAGNHDELEVEVSSRGECRSCAQRRLAGEDRDDRVELDEQAAQDVGPLLRGVGEPVGDVPLLEEFGPR